MDESISTTVRAPKPETALRAIIASQGHHVCDAPETLGSLLGEACPDHGERVALLLRAQEARIPSDLIWSKVAPRADLGNRLAARLQTQCALSETDALWAVNSWMDALEVKTSRPRIRPSQSAVPEPLAAVSMKDAPSFAAAISAEASVPGPKNPTAQSSASLKSEPATAGGRRFNLPTWVVGAIAAVFVLILGMALYVSTGPPANATRAPGVIRNLPPGYKAPMRMYRGRLVTTRPAKPAP